MAKILPLKTSSPMELGGLDAALIFREDGRIEVSLPHIETEGPVPDHLFIALALCQGLSDEAFVHQLKEQLLNTSAFRKGPKAMNDH